MRIPNQRTNRAAALISMLLIMSLMVIMVLAITLLSRSEVKSADTYTTQVSADSFSQLATNLVISQIRGATGQTGEAWASQPGAIRRYDDKGRFLAGYKLYSDDDMIITRESEFLEDLPEADWQDKPEHWVDLNAPVIRDSRPVFPILDPRAEGQVEGFSFSADVEGTVKSDSDTARLPMPTRWIYILEDGTSGHLDPQTDEFVGFRPDGSRVVPDEANPIVGRVAFWGDDETSKVNINTASEPTFWDTPRSVSREDLWYARSQPTQKEYQRYPGHPATTALSTILFGNQVRRETLAQLEKNGQMGANQAIKKAIYDIIPRINVGGSEAGMKVTTKSTIPAQEDDDHLYASLDELIFMMPRLQGDSRSDRTNSPIVSRELLERSRFFLTANSRAPELNLFGLPRVSIWPTDSDDKSDQYLTPYDKLIRFCSTTPAGHQFFFTRKSADSPTEDWGIRRNQEVYDYLKNLTSKPIPGVGGEFSSKYGDDHEQILTEIFDYIRSTNLYDDTRPGNRFTDHRNHTGHGQVAPIRIGDTMGFGRIATFSEFAVVFACCADPEVPESVDLIKAADPKITDVGTGERVIQLAIVPEAFIPGQGWSAIQSKFRVVFEGLDGLTLNDEPLYPSKAKTQYDVSGDISGGFHGRAWGGSAGFRRTVHDTLVSERIKIETVGDRMDFKQTKNLTVKIYAEHTEAADQLVQTFSLRFPDASFPIPTIQKTGTIGGNGAGATPAQDWWGFNNPGKRMAYRTNCPGSPWTSVNNNSPATDTRNPGWGFGVLRGGFWREGDVVRSLAPFHGSGSNEYGGDFRLVTMDPVVEENVFKPHAGYFDPNIRIDHTLNLPAGAHYYWRFGNADIHDTDGVYPAYNYSVATQLTDASYHFGKFPDYPRGYATSSGSTFLSKPINTGDFDNGTALTPDGAYLNKPDGGNRQMSWYGRTPRMFHDYPVPYFDTNWGHSTQGPAYFSPSRQINSPVMFGSLPSGVKRNIPWQTLLFRPQSWGHPANVSLPHPGFQDPKDHYLLDLFWMPVVEPYAISEPFSTAGKINLNYQILPFTNIKRATGLHAVMKSEEMMIVPDEEAGHYKNWDHALADYYIPPLPDRMYWRQLINIDETLKQFDDRFLNGEIFKSATEICDVHLVPLRDRDGQTSLTLPTPAKGGRIQPQVDNIMKQHWLAHSPTGDNMRERPYSNIYPRLTTKSNTFRVHVRSQVIKKPRGSDPTTFNPELDTVAGEWRGSTLVERYIDPNNEEIPDYVTDSSAIGSQTLDRYYRFRILHRKRFGG